MAEVVQSQRWELYRLLGERVRLRLLALAAEEELTIGELAELLGESQPNVSRQVAPLRRAGLLRVRKQGTRVLVRLDAAAPHDAVVADALAAGRAIVADDGSARRIAEILRARDAAAREFFARPRDPAGASVGELPPEMPAYLAALAPLIPHRALAVDVGTGDGSLLDALAPIFDRVVAVDREQAQLDRAGQRLALRGYQNVELVRDAYDGAQLRARVAELAGPRGGADVVFAARVLHHAPKLDAAMRALAVLARPGGAVVVIDYQAHEDERLREMLADLWLGFTPAELARLAREAGLRDPEVRAIPTARCGQGPDAQVGWQVLTAFKGDS